MNTSILKCKELYFKTRGKGRLSLLIGISPSFILGVSYGNSLDFGPYIILYFGPLLLAAGRDNGSGY